MSDIEQGSDAAEAPPESPPAEFEAEAPPWFVIREPVLGIIKAVLSVMILAWLAVIALMAYRIGWSARLLFHFKSVKVLRLVKNVIGDFGSKGSGKAGAIWRRLVKHGHA